MTGAGPVRVTAPTAASFAAARAPNVTGWSKHARAGTLQSANQMAAMYNRKLGVNIRNFQLCEYVTVAIPKAERTTLGCAAQAEG